MWFTDYLRKEIGVITHRGALKTELNEKVFYLSHGYEIDARSARDKILHTLFNSKFLQMILRALHPRWVLAVAHRWLRHNRLSRGIALPFRGEKEALVQFARKQSVQQNIDYFIFGHRHTPILLPVEDCCQLVILGEWAHGGEYAVFDGVTLSLQEAI